MTARPASSAFRDFEHIQFAFLDLNGNQISVPLTQEQVDSYRDTLDLFATTPLRVKESS